MKWSINLENEKNTKIVLPTVIRKNCDFIVQIDGTEYSARLHGDLESLSLKPVNGSEDRTESIEIKQFQLDQKSPDLNREFSLEYKTSNGLHRLQSKLCLDGPGLEFVQKNLASSSAVIRSPMAGKVLNILVKDQQLIQQGEPLLIVEAMKMENQIKSPKAGRVKLGKIEVSQQVSLGETLVEIEQV